MKKPSNFVNSKKILSTYKKVRDNCPAYQDFFSKRNLNKVSSLEDIPLSDKDNYFKKYDLRQKMYKDKNLSDYYMVCSSSGSTGKPTFWPRDAKNDDLAEAGHTAFLDEHFQVLSKKSLIVIALDLGSSTAGMIHSRFSWDLSKKSNSTVITPGCKPNQVVSMIDGLYKHYDQVVLLAYPTLINEIIENALEKKLSFFDWNVNIGYTGAGANEVWRLELIDKYDIPSDSIISFYGCTEVGFVGVESKAVNNLVNVCLRDKELTKEIFGVSYLPTVVDNLTPGKYFEVVNKELVVTVDQPIPLVRFNLHDLVKIISLKEIKSILKQRKLNIDLSNSKSDKWLVVYGRKNNGYFSIEEVKRAVYAVSCDVLLKEFQFQEINKEDFIEINFTFYLKKDSILRKAELKKIKSDLFNILSQKQKCKVVLEVKSEEDRIGYKSGKLLYFL